nr:uncharacterized protein LOC123747094 [Procambarus clarkii]
MSWTGRWSLLLLLVWSLLGGRECESGGKGVLRVRVTSFTNDLSRGAEGECCLNPGGRRAPPCSLHCRTFFRVCATHSARPHRPRPPPPSATLNTTLGGSSSLLAAAILNTQPTYLVTQALTVTGLGRRGRSRLGGRRSAGENGTTSPTPAGEREGWGSSSRRTAPLPQVPCTLGLLVTAVVTNNSLHAPTDGALDITLPFTIPWPVTFKLIIEAWHDVTGRLFKIRQPPKRTERVGQLIVRHVGHHRVEGERVWAHYAHANAYTTLNYSLKVTCVTPFRGPRCSQRCDEGWTGPECTSPACLAGCHPVHGNCTQPGQCLCAPGWRGRECSECIPRSGCQHGSCTTPDQCLCHPGWSGPLCSKPVCREGCHPSHGYCDLPGECRCRIGWTGPTCEECKPLPGCVHGSCTKPLECKCDSGWTGGLCQTPVCGHNCSKVHGHCTKPGECRCDVGWWGERCDLCFPYPGCEHGTCTQPWECTCNPGWTGMLCDTRGESTGWFCERHQGWCLNGGTCIDVAGGRNYTCSCPSLFTGQRCDYLAHLAPDHHSARTGLILPTGSRHNVHIISPDTLSSLGTYSMTQPTTGIPEDTDADVTDEEDPKDARRRFLQKHARISFRQPKLASSEEDSDKLPFAVVERKLLPLPVVLPRVSDITRDGRRFAYKPANKQSTPIIILGLRAPENIQEKVQASETSGKNQINENRRFLRHQQESPGFVTDAVESGHQPPQEGPVLVKVLNSQRRPILVSSQARALPRSNTVSPATARTSPGTRQQPPVSSGPTNTSTTPTPATPDTSEKPVATTRPFWKARQVTPTLGSSERASVFTPAPEEVDVVEGRESVVQTYYNENVNGRVHIGDTSSVDDAAPHKEIFDAFIELKKV